MTNAGNYSCAVRLQRPKTDRDPVYNDFVAGWEDVRTVWVSIDTRFGSERFQKKTGSIKSEVTHVLRGDFLDWADVKATWRVLYDGRVFQVQAVRLDNDRRREAMIDTVETDEDPSEENA